MAGSLEAATSLSVVMMSLADCVAAVSAPITPVVEAPAVEAVTPAPEATPTIEPAPAIVAEVAVPSSVVEHAADLPTALAAPLPVDQLRSMLDALDRRMAAYVADVRGEVGSVGSAMGGLNTALANVQSQHLQLRNELQTQEGMHTQNLNARFHELREDVRDGLADVRSELRALAAEQRHARTVIVAVVLIAAAAVIAVTIAF